MITDPKPVRDETDQVAASAALRPETALLLDPKTRLEDLTPKQRAALDEIYRIMSLRFEGGTPDVAERHNEKNP